VSTAREMSRQWRCLNALIDNGKGYFEISELKETMAVDKKQHCYPGNVMSFGVRLFYILDLKA
jgi:hypothetical protein